MQRVLTVLLATVAVFVLLVPVVGCSNVFGSDGGGGSSEEDPPEEPGEETTEEPEDATPEEPSDDSGDTDTPVAVTGVSMVTADFELGTTRTTQLDWTVLPKDAEDTSVTFSSSDPAVASVDADGLVTGEAVGTADITVETTDGSLTDSVKVTVVEYTAVSSIGLSISSDSPSASEAKVSQFFEFEVEILPSDATETGYSISSSGTGEASIASKEAVDGGDPATGSFSLYLTAAGDLSVTVTSDDDATISDTIELTVKSDTIAPRLVECLAIDSDSIYLSYSERMNVTDITSASNYAVTVTGEKAARTIDSVDRVSSDDDPRDGVYVHLATALSEGDELTVEVDETVSDRAGNTIATTDGDDDDTLADNTGRATYYPTPPDGVDASKIVESSGMLSLDPNAVNVQEGWETWQVMAVPAGEPLTQTSVVGVARINPADGGSDGPFNESFDQESSDKVFDNGSYDLYVSANYIISSEESQLTFNVTDVVTYEVTTGL